MATIAGEGTTLADGSEQTLLSTTTLGTFQANVGLANMQAGDTVVVRIKTKVLSTGTLRTVYEETFSDAQAAPNLIQIGVPVPSGYEFALTLEQTGGTNRNYDWRVDQIGTVTISQAGTLTATGAEDDFLDTTTNATYVLAVDLGNMAGSDAVTLRAREAIRSGGTRQVAYEYDPPVGPQATPDILMLSLPLSSPYRAQFTLEQTAGTYRQFPYAVYRVAA